MAARVTDADVKKLIETTVSPLTIFIDQAALLVTEEIGTAAASGLSEARLTEIERWLSAHFVAASIDPQSKSEGASGISVSYEGQQGMGLNATRYGQQAILLDTTGTLKRMADASISAGSHSIDAF